MHALIGCAARAAGEVSERGQRSTQFQEAVPATEVRGVHKDHDDTRTQQRVDEPFGKAVPVLDVLDIEEGEPTLLSSPFQKFAHVFFRPLA